MKECLFCECENSKEGVIYETVNWMVKEDAYPVSNGHVLIIPKEHFETYFELPDMLKESIHYVIEHVKSMLDEKYHPDGYNIGFNCGEASGQTINHFHIHVIPRYNGDVDNPRGGVRGVIPSKQNY